MVRENASRTERQHRQQQGASADATASCRGAALGLWVDPSKPHPGSHSEPFIWSNNLLSCLATCLPTCTS